MAIELLIPVPDEVLSLRTISEPQTLGNKLKIHSEKAGVPSFKNARIAIVGVQETRSIGQPHQRKQNLNGIRKALYSLYIGNWNNNIIDLGDIPIGDKEKDSHKALHDIAKEMYQRNILLIAFGGSQENTLGLCSVLTNLRFITTSPPLIINLILEEMGVLFLQIPICQNSLLIVRTT